MKIDAEATASASRLGRSSPGQPPGRDTGELVASLNARLARPRGREARASVSAGARYGFMLESGTREIAPRPFLVPAARRHYDGFRSRVQAVIDAAVQQTNSDAA